MRYWMTGLDGKVYGPFDLQQLQSMAVSGQLSASAKLCAEGSQAWVAASSLIGASPSAAAPQIPPSSAPMAPPPMSTAFTPPPGSVPPPANAAWTPLSLTNPILVTLFCCVIGGIISIVYTSQANTKGMQGNIAAAQADAKTARTWMIVSITIGILIFILYFVAAILEEGAR